MCVYFLKWNLNEERRKSALPLRLKLCDSTARTNLRSDLRDFECLISDLNDKELLLL